MPVSGGSSREGRPLSPGVSGPHLAAPLLVPAVPEPGLLHGGLGMELRNLERFLLEERGRWPRLGQGAETLPPLTHILIKKVTLW